MVKENNKDLMQKRKCNIYSEQNRKCIIDAYHNEDDWKALCSAMKINLNTAYLWIRKDQYLPLKRGGPRMTKKTPEIISALINWIEMDCQMTLSQCADKIQQHFNINVSLNSIKNWLDGQLFSLKLIRPTVQNMNAPENKVKRRDYLNRLLEAKSNGRTIIWIDETNFNLFCKRSEGRLKIGSRSRVLTLNSKGSNLHCIAAMSSTRIFNFECRQGSYKGEDCKLWIRKLISVCYEEGIKSPTIVIDNAPVHSQIEDAVDENEDVEILRLAPYSYLMNPIELAWSSFKSVLKAKLREKMPALLLYTRSNGGMSAAEYRMKTMEKIAYEAKETLTTQKLLNFANHVEKYYSAVFQMKDLVEDI